MRFARVRAPTSLLLSLSPPPSAVAVTSRSWGRRPSRAAAGPPRARAAPASRRVASVEERVSVMPEGGALPPSPPRPPLTGGANRLAKSRRDPHARGGWGLPVATSSK